MAAVRGRPSGQPGSPFPGFPTCVQLPPIRSETESADRALDHYLRPTIHIMASTRVVEPMYLANPVYDTESLLANASETLSSVTEMLNNFAAVLDTAHRKTALGIAQIVMLSELAVNQALDNAQPVT
ncbi:DUF6124 family protein [Pseudomonas sp. ZY71]|uniref:DUF6124 family protein n=1 Tax=Pseudomonas sp. ZY71 TaxID=3115647 RepID=UPI003FA77806